MTSKPFTQRRLVKALLTIDWGYLVLGIVIGILLNPLLRAIDPAGVREFLDNLVPEAVGIIFTVLILDRLNGVRQAQQTLEQLVRRAHSRYNHTALAAIEELRVLGKLQDGTLSGRNLRGSNWQDANLYQTDLRGTDLTNADLYRADLVQANLRGARVSDEQLAATDIMHGATMPDGSRYDGRYNLPGDFAYAQREDVDPGSPEEMAPWYGVSLERYLEGQAWAQENLHRFARRSATYEEDSPPGWNIHNTG